MTTMYSDNSWHKPKRDEMSILLTNEEFFKLHEDFFGEGSGSCCEVDDSDLCYRVAKAQLKKVWEWGNEICTEHTTDPLQLRRLCSACWKSLEKEIKGEGK